MNLTSFETLGMFATAQIMNWAAIRDLGLSEASPDVRRTSSVVSGAASPGAAYAAVAVSEVSLSLKMGGVKVGCTPWGFCMCLLSIHLFDIVCV